MNLKLDLGPGLAGTDPVMGWNGTFPLAPERNFHTYRAWF